MWAEERRYDSCTSGKRTARLRASGLAGKDSGGWERGGNGTRLWKELG